MRIEYRTKYETKTYLIKEINEIDETDLSILNSTKEDRITLITCIANQKSKRLKRNIHFQLEKLWIL